MQIEQSMLASLSSFAKRGSPQNISGKSTIRLTIKRTSKADVHFHIGVFLPNHKHQLLGPVDNVDSETRGQLYSVQ